MTRYLSLLVQFIPLSVFATYAYWYGTPTNDRWIEAFMLGGALACLQLLAINFIAKGRPLNRLILAANIYLVLGAIACLLQWWDFMAIYAAAMEAGILGLMVLVGIASTLFSKVGFVGVQGVERLQVLRSSALLLGASLFAFSLSMTFTGNRWLAGVVPILFLAIAQRLLASRLEAARNT